jgi:DNA invertase Pin-like site-specific DNA recombinase
MLLDLGDTSTATGELTANMIASAAQYERRLIGQRSTAATTRPTTHR